MIRKFPPKISFFGLASLFPLIRKNKQIMEFKMQTKKKTNQISKQLEEIQKFLKKKDDHANRQASNPLNFVEAAQYLSLSHSTLYKLTYQRKIPCHKPTGKVLYFFKSELDEWITKNSEKCRTKSDELKENEDEEDSETDASAKIK
jgi:excisionase family DNA binding protein